MSKLEIRQSYTGERGMMVCSGRIVLGPEAEQLQKTFDEQLLRVNVVLLDLAAVDYLDSSGIGVLIRNTTKAQRDGKRIEIVAMSEPVRHTLEVSKVMPVLKVASADEPQLPAGTKILFVHPSADIRLFAKTVLTKAGAAVDTCACASDAKPLLLSGRHGMLMTCDDVDIDGRGAKVVKLPASVFSQTGEESAKVMIAKAMSTGS